MRLIAVIASALMLSACSSKTAPPAPSTTAPVAGPLIDCGKPANEAQQLVCSDQHLTDLDRRLQVAYQEALDRPGADNASLTAAENSWAAHRDNCAQDTDMRTCVQQAYQTRLVQLAIADPATVAPPVITYRCPRDYGPLTAQFYNQFDPKAMVLNWKGDQRILFVEMSGSGARYGRQGIGHWGEYREEYWEHQGEVRLDFSGYSDGHTGGAKFVCSTP